MDFDNKYGSKHFAKDKHSMKGYNRLINAQLLFTSQIQNLLFDLKLVDSAGHFINMIDSDCKSLYNIETEFDVFAFYIEKCAISDFLIKLLQSFNPFTKSGPKPRFQFDFESGIFKGSSYFVSPKITYIPPHVLNDPLHHLPDLTLNAENEKFAMMLFGMVKVQKTVDKPKSYVQCTDNPFVTWLLNTVGKLALSTLIPEYRMYSLNVDNPELPDKVIDYFEERLTIFKPFQMRHKNIDYVVYGINDANSEFSVLKVAESGESVDWKVETIKTGDLDAFNTEPINIKNFNLDLALWVMLEQRGLKGIYMYMDPNDSQHDDSFKLIDDDPDWFSVVDSLYPLIIGTKAIRRPSFVSEEYLVLEISESTKPMEPFNVKNYSGIKSTESVLNAYVAY